MEWNGSSWVCIVAHSIDCRCCCDCCCVNQAELKHSMLLLEQINNQILVGWSGFFFLFPVALLSPHNEVEFFVIFFFSTLRLVSKHGSWCVTNKPNLVSGFVRPTMTSLRINDFPWRSRKKNYFQVSNWPIPDRTVQRRCLTAVTTRLSAHKMCVSCRNIFIGKRKQF